ncbi:nitrogenase cofactor biosynthesis protein NifB [Carboxylicivirga linearis]|uniref:FeMo cofactor biosynthesis protein NifB n=1 Tax=Carboxylicivirga linearis TaxID=1628157 RepID=A0ABS5JST9_9BACT|nr:nitrogenase cofactor biosynthesis protein NifB [Carboxylicivirga linearis]MBS2097599.1 nitrogenase cofactor biosynthesis protein NifB [Carboxylicivirga linearis]
MKDFTKHPCFNKGAHHTNARVHLPVAPQCNVKCNYCNRKFDCVNESRPGVTSNVLQPEQALEYVKNLKNIMPELTVVGIAGPGDPFANAEKTMKTLRLVKEEFPDMLLCVSTNGLNVGPYIDELKELDVSHVTVTLNSFRPETLEKIYGWVRYDKRGYFGKSAGEVLLEKQVAAIKKMKSLDMVVKVNSIVIPGVNDNEIEEVAEKIAEMGVDLMNTIPLFPVKDTPFEDLTEPSSEWMKALRQKVETYLPPMSHCARCRADAAGLLGKDSAEAAQLLSEAAKLTINDGEERPYVAVASMEGILVNQHLGEADRIHVFKETPNGYKLVNIRTTPDRGIGDKRWLELADTLNDCRSMLVGGIGPKPSKILSKSGIKVIEMSGMIDQGLDHVYKGTELRTLCKSEVFKCGSGCTGNASGCG